jgi:hypothetical protein
MDSPFPGMDPYLENVIYWKSVHQNLISLITFALNESLPDAFLARSEGRSYILPKHELIYPDAIVVRAPSEEDTPPSNLGVTTIAQTVTEPLVFEFSEQEIYEPYVSVFSADDKQVVAIIEVLSPTNKAPESTGREEYVRKQREILRNPAHLIEIDLLRGGLHTVAVPREAVLSRTDYDYIVSLRRARVKKNRFEVWPFTVQESMPTIWIPLTEGWPDFPLDLPSIWQETYRLGRWGKALDYSRDPEPALPPDDARWMDSLLRSTGVRF